MDAAFIGKWRSYDNENWIMSEWNAWVTAVCWTIYGTQFWQLCLKNLDSETIHIK